MKYIEILFGLVGLIALFSGQVMLIKRFVAFLKVSLSLRGNAVRLVSFAVGVVIGVLFFWPWVELNPDYPLSVYILTGVLFLLLAGLTASGDYDLKSENLS